QPQPLRHWQAARDTPHRIWIAVAARRVAIRDDLDAVAALDELVSEHLEVGRRTAAIWVKGAGGDQQIERSVGQASTPTRLSVMRMSSKEYRVPCSVARAPNWPNERRGRY